MASQMDHKLRCHACRLVMCPLAIENRADGIRVHCVNRGISMAKQIGHELRYLALDVLVPSEA